MEREKETGKLRFTDGEAVRCSTLAGMAFMSLLLICCAPAENSWRATAEGAAVWAVAFILMYAALRLLRKWRKNGQMSMTDSIIKSVEE